MGGAGAVLDDELERARAAGAQGRTVVLVEGVSDRRAIEALARRRGQDLHASGVTVVPMAGITNAARFLSLLGPQGFDTRLSGLYDRGEEAAFAHALQRAGLGEALTTPAMNELGFFVCVRDLEDELIRALGAERMDAVIREQGELRRFRSFQRQPAQRGKSIERQLWRWMGNRKIRYASVLVDALDLSAIPSPLERLLDHL
jgi:hypothetical protein